MMTAVKMSIDVQSMQHLIHNVPTWAQFAAQGFAAETGGHKLRVTCSHELRLQNVQRSN